MISGKEVVGPAHYKLYGALYHHGESSSGVHYTVDMLHPNGGGEGEAWLHIDNEAVSMVRPEDVFGDGRCAYMLFYCRTAPTQT
jgi:ubiquitin carboxyl-terminal hydrolase 10